MYVSDDTKREGTRHVLADSVTPILDAPASKQKPRCARKAA
jgi:hypothetical protein